MGGFFSRNTEVNDGIPIPRNQSQNITTQRNSSNHGSIYGYQPRPQQFIPREPIPVRIIRPTAKFNEHFFPQSEEAREIFRHPSYEYHELNSFDTKYRDVRRRITNRYFKIDAILEIDVPFLKRSYLLKKEKEQKAHLEELELFHGTKWRNVEKICKNNFNWRLRGTHVGNRFGEGVSFSCNAMYAANYSSDEEQKVMFIAKVMIGKRCQGRKTMKLPDEGCDTSTKQGDNIVLVKYEDNEFYPLYLIKFHIAPGYVPRNQRE